MQHDFVATKSKKDHFTMTIKGDKSCYILLFLFNDFIPTTKGRALDPKIIITSHKPVIVIRLPAVSFVIFETIFKCNINPVGTILKIIKQRLKIRFNVPPNPETIAAGFLCFRSINIAPSPVDNPQTAIETEIMRAIVMICISFSTLSMEDDIKIRAALIIIIANRDEKNFVNTMRFILVGDSPITQKPCPSKLNCG